MSVFIFLQEIVRYFDVSGSLFVNQVHHSQSQSSFSQIKIKS